MTGKLSRRYRKFLLVCVSRIQTLRLFYVIKNQSFSTCISHSKLEASAEHLFSYNTVLSHNIHESSLVHCEDVLRNVVY